ncbi:MAG TPA: hypothetical protein VLL97_03140 [Acidobacteriota bacterium]|nr:hypothetical protein [Acidobacteriota bacterium]
MMAIKVARACFFLSVVQLFCLNSMAQSFSGDARKIGMGGIGYSENITARMMEDERPYSSIIIPLGLIQLIQDRDRFNPDNDNFDPILVMEYAANPFHIVFGRDPGGARSRFVQDIVEGRIDLDLNSYRGFTPTNRLLAEGLANPSWGKTFRFNRRPDGAFQGFYIGVGPYISAKTDLEIDKNLTDIWRSPTNVYKPNTLMRIADVTTGQLALAVTGGYRGRFALPGGARGGKAGRNGIYVAVNYHYLHGFRYENAELAIQFDTDADGMVTLNPETIPAAIDYYNSRSGKGFALDFGIGAIVDRWEFGFGANGVGNRINWDDMTLKQFRINAWSQTGSDFVEYPLSPESPRMRVELPVSYSGNVGYHLKNWSFAAEISQGFQGTGFHGGMECRLGAIEFRGGGRYGLDRWHPSGGIGLNLGRRFSVDVAVFGTTTNIERQLRPAVAVSFRLNRAES